LSLAYQKDKKMLRLSGYYQFTERQIAKLDEGCIINAYLYFMLLHRFGRICLNTKTWGLPALEIPWKLLDYLQTTHRFEVIF
jgi:hypothetical protein